MIVLVKVSFRFTRVFARRLATFLPSSCRSTDVVDTAFMSVDVDATVDVESLALEQEVSKTIPEHSSIRCFFESIPGEILVKSIVEITVPSPIDSAVMGRSAREAFTVYSIFVTIVTRSANL